MTQQGDGSGRPPGGPPWPQQPPHGQWPQQPPQGQQPQYQQPQHPPQYQQPQYQQPQYQQPQYQQPQQPQYPPQQGYGQPQQHAPQGQQHYQQAPQQRPPTQPPAGGASIGTAFSRAFRLRIDPSEVTDHERDKLLAAGITSPVVQAFLAWRRSVLLIAALAILPLLGFRFYEASKEEGLPDTLKMLQNIQTIVDVVFAIILWSQLPRWTRWRQQRRIIAAGWLLYFLMPFLIFLYPFRDLLRQSIAQAQGLSASDAEVAKALAPVVGIIASFAALLELAPKAVALLPGILRASIISKLLFPGASGPGWLILLTAPIYATILYLVLVIPYQVTGSGFFVAAIASMIGAQIWLGRMGYKLARPERIEEAIALVRRVRLTYLILYFAGAAFVVAGLYQLFEQLGIPYVGMVKFLVNFVVTVLLLALVATDLIVANLARGQMLLAEGGTQQAFATFQRDVSQFADPVVTSQQQSGPRR